MRRDRVRARRMSWPPFVGVAAILIEPHPLRSNHPMPPQRGEQMDCTRALGLPASIDWHWGWTAARSRPGITRV